MSTCPNCKTQFQITPTDSAFYSRIQVPTPTHCPQCRLQRRLSTRCERSLYKRKCALCNKDIISILHQDNPFPVYCRDCFWSDKWDPLEYGQDYDFSKPFFEQYKQLQNKVPRLLIFTNKSQNSDYTCHSFQNKNCYLSFGIKDCEDLYYCARIISGKDSLDLLQCTECELSYECIDCLNCYSCLYLQNSTNCTDCAYGYDLTGCQNCLACAGLRHKQYHILNKKMTKEEYEQTLKNLDPSQIQSQFEQIKLKTPHKYLNVLNNQNCTGDYLRDSKNSHKCYDSDNLEDCGYCVFIFRDKDCYDLYGVGDSELSYESMGVEEIHNLKFSYTTDNTQDSYYLSLCFASKNLFGCISLRRKQYCILNKQYSKEEYETLLPKIIDHMKQAKEFGEYFPISLSPCCYNESVAQEYFPLTKEEILKKGWNYREKDARDYLPPTKDILACANCKKNYKIIPPEQKFYTRHDLPIPTLCPDCRHANRMQKRNPRQLHTRKCAKCHSETPTTYSPNHKEIIYCEKCYHDSLN